jgi:hypothetical protein
VPQFAKERRELFARNAAYCRLCILDAFQGRLSNGLANNSKKSWWIYTIFCVQTSELLFQCVMGACTFHTISIFFEPENACANSAIYTFLQVLVLLVYSFDIALKMSYEGIEVTDPCSLFLLLLHQLCADYCVFLCVAHCSIGILQSRLAAAVRDRDHPVRARPGGESVYTVRQPPAPSGGRAARAQGPALLRGAEEDDARSGAISLLFTLCM